MRAGSGSLPYLLKVLAADEPLSLQAHPSSAQAAEGFARENAAGIPVDAPDPQLPRRQPQAGADLRADRVPRAGRLPRGPQTLALLRALDVDELAPHVALLAAQPDADGPARTVHHLDHAAAVRAGPGGARAAGRRACGWRSAGGEFGREARMALELSERYPGDAGVLAALLLNLAVLQPGEALFLPAGNLHAYLSGAGVELMANSDNVLRGGLTSKHVDVAELLRVLDFTPARRRSCVERRRAPMVRYDTDAAEFLLRRFEGDRPRPTSPSPTAGRGSCSARRARRWCARRAALPLAGGRSGCWVAASPVAGGRRPPRHHRDAGPERSCSWPATAWTYAASSGLHGFPGPPGYLRTAGRGNETGACSSTGRYSPTSPVSFPW